MTLDPATAAFLAADAASGRPPWRDMPPAEARAAYRQLAVARRGLHDPAAPPAGPACSVEGVRHDDLGLWCRIYRPAGVSAFDGPLPLVLFVHGGGWVLGDLDTHDPLARAFVGLPAVVISVEYRLAPEHAHPAAHEDVWTWLGWAAEGMGRWSHTDRIVLAGDSAGGLLAAATALRVRDEAGAGLPPVVGQCLVYPALDPDMALPSQAANAEGYGLTGADMAWYYDQVLPPGAPRDASFSPWYAEDLTGLAPAVVVTAGYDPLADDGLAYGDRLREAGVPTASLHLPGLVHGFFGMGGTSPAAAAGVEATVAALRGLLAQTA